MQVYHGIAGLASVPGGAAVSIGNFDGIHRGHRAILALARRLRETGAAASVAVVTFEPHPITVLRPALAPPRLTPPPLKHALLAERGVDYLVELPPSPDVLNLTAEQFWASIHRDLRPAHLIEGESFTFGKGRGGTVRRLAEWSAASRIQLHVVEPVRVPLLDCHVAPVSSSLVRWLLLHGRARDAALALGQPYLLAGTVIHGFARGRSIGIPTANLHCDHQLIPAEGVYVGLARVAGHPYPAAISIGTMPTFGEHPQQIEVHLIGFDGDLYGQELRVEVKDWVREQWKFPSVEALQRRMQSDLSWIRQRAAFEACEPLLSDAAAP